MRIINLNPKYTALIHDLLKTATVLIVVEIIQFMILGQPLFDSSFTRTALHQLIGLVVFYIFVDSVIGAGNECCHINKLLEEEPKPAEL